MASPGMQALLHAGTQCRGEPLIQNASSSRANGGSYGRRAAPEPRVTSSSRQMRSMKAPYRAMITVTAQPARRRRKAK